MLISLTSSRTMTERYPRGQWRSTSPPVHTLMHLRSIDSRADYFVLSPIGFGRFIP
jgi:hypothetical protein